MIYKNDDMMMIKIKIWLVLSPSIITITYGGKSMAGLAPSRNMPKLKPNPNPKKRIVIIVIRMEVEEKQTDRCVGDDMEP